MNHDSEQNDAISDNVSFNEINRFEINLLVKRLRNDVDISDQTSYR